MVDEADVAAVAEACRSLPEPTGDYLEDDVLVNLVATVVDCQMRTTVVERAIEHFRSRARPALLALDDLAALFERWPASREGNGALARWAAVVGQPSACGRCAPPT